MKQGKKMITVDLKQVQNDHIRSKTGKT